MSPGSSAVLAGRRGEGIAQAEREAALAELLDPAAGAAEEREGVAGADELELGPVSGSAGRRKRS